MSVFQRFPANQIITFRLTAPQREALERLAAEQGIRVADLIRSALEDKYGVAVRAEEARAAARERSSRDR